MRINTQPRYGKVGSDLKIEARILDSAGAATVGGDTIELRQEFGDFIVNNNSIYPIATEYTVDGSSETWIKAHHDNKGFNLAFTCPKEAFTAIGRYRATVTTSSDIKYVFEINITD